MVPVQQLLLLYELGALGVGQLATEGLRLKQLQEMEALWVPKKESIIIIPSGGYAIMLHKSSGYNGC